MLTKQTQIFFMQKRFLFTCYLFMFGAFLQIVVYVRVSLPPGDVLFFIFGASAARAMIYFLGNFLALIYNSSKLSFKQSFAF